MSFPLSANPGLQERWHTAVQHRITEETKAPRFVRYVMFQRDRSGAERNREEGVWSLVYEADGRAQMDVVSASRGGKDFTEERRRRLRRDRSQIFQMLDTLTPFDAKAQPSLTLGNPTLTRVRGRTAWEYPFELPQDNRRLVGTAWIDNANGKPLGFRYTLRPLPLFLHTVEVDVSFDQERYPGRISRVEFFFAAYFLIFSWRIGGIAWPEDWIELGKRPIFKD